MFSKDIEELHFRKWKRQKGIIKKHELRAVQQCIEFLKENCTQRGLFLLYGSRFLVDKIATKIRNGDEDLLDFLKSQSATKECASALNSFLRSLRKPLLSARVQELILSENYGVCPKVVALDALSLLSEDLEGYHRELFVLMMEMMRTLSTVGSLRPSELRVCYAPYLLIPLFFNISVLSRDILRNWRNIADTLNEMIICFSFFLEGCNFQTKNECIFALKRGSQEKQRNRKASKYAMAQSNPTERAVLTYNIPYSHLLYN